MTQYWRGSFGLTRFVIPVQLLYSIQTKGSGSFPQTRPPHGSSTSSSCGAGGDQMPAQTRPVQMGGATGSFYKPPSKPAAGAAAPPPSNSSTTCGIPAKKAAISVRGRCVAHTEGRFRVEVSYHAELIATFKSIPSKNYGKSVLLLWCFYCSDVALCFWNDGISI